MAAVLNFDALFWNLLHPSKKDMLDVSHRYHRHHRRGCGGIVGT